MIQSSVTIASIFPFKKKVTFPWSPKRGGNSHDYVLEAGNAEKPATLVVSDAYEYPYYGHDIGKRETMISADSIADNLINTWSGSVLGREGEIGPGVFKCAGDAPTKEEIARAEELQFAWCRNVYRDGEDLVKQGRYRDITETHRFAARYLGLSPAWLTDLQLKDVRDCPFCGEQIKAAAKVCKHCGRDIEQEAVAPAVIHQAAAIKPPIQVRK